ncbi:alpha-1,6-mannosyl-glycoprotein 2-beta-N-acetylglucosaminyltransferase isoform X1 [Tachypleus tridentatus]|uniref:alpha-1,6-mannosyl-glycoprotein 2-beta-N-acetylglucosaminyltransferase isoform X1 n=2 Tax=Tachypleus tridentatus TaxID=6853 RepID=UPI003FD3C548
MKVRCFFWGLCCRNILSLINFIFLLFIVSFLWLQLHVGSLKSQSLDQKLERKYNNVAVNIGKVGSALNSTVTSPPLVLEHVKQAIKKINTDQLIINSYKYGPLSSGNPVIVIQVHNRYQYLSALIRSLQQTKGIEKVLVIFSHDLFDREINQLIQKISFCKVTQIFYPHSIQLHPDTFPGQDPNDCPRDMKKEEALVKGCNNAHYPDRYGHFREASYTQAKHHWWWKMNYVFDGLEVTRNHTGPFLFLEEDHFVFPDILHVLNLMELKNKDCSTCNILCLGNYAKSFNFPAKGNQVEVTKWLSSKHNMGMVINRSLWTQIKMCAKDFCTFDDYNWDWTLQHVSFSCLPSPLNVMVTVSSRVLHIGECGVHHKGKDCSSERVVKRAESILSAARRYLFPTSLSLHQGLKRTLRVPKGNGGWGDIRDHKLCLQQADKNYTLISPR